MADVAETFKYFNKMNELKCDICGKYLSISPILFNDAVGSVCGRCYNSGETKKFDGSIEFQFQEVFEIVAKYLKFPCSFDVNGCSQSLEWENVEQHEENCEYKEILCPLSGEEFLQNGDVPCDWKGNGKELFPHMLDVHKDIITEEPILKIDSSKHFNSSISLSKVLETNVLIMMHYKEKFERHFCNVLMDLPFKDLRIYNFDLKIFGENGSKSIILPSNCVMPSNHRVLSGENINNCLDVDLRNFYKLLAKPERLVLFFKIYQVSATGEIILPIKSKTSVETELQILRCQCGNQLAPPIYVCSTGHNFCSKCKSRSSVCVICNTNCLPGQNTTLETISRLTTFPCKNKDCTFRSELNQLDVHQNNCILTEKNCILKCGWKGSNPDMYMHIKNTHSFLYLNQVYKYDSKTKVHPILFDDNIFILTINFALNNPLSINLQCLGMTEGCYGYEFTILSTHSNIKLVTHHLCQSLLYDVNGAEIQTTSITGPFDFFRQFITDYQQFEYKINIKKN